LDSALHKGLEAARLDFDPTRIPELGVASDQGRVLRFDGRGEDDVCSVGRERSRGYGSDLKPAIEDWIPVVDRVDEICTVFASGSKGCGRQRKLERHLANHRLSTSAQKNQLNLARIE